MKINTIKKLVLGSLCGLLTPAFVCRGEGSALEVRANTDLPVPGEIHHYKAPLYWSIYEYAREMELAGIPYGQMDLTEEQWDKVIDMMATKFKPYGYDMICTDGFLPQWAASGEVYMTHYGSMSLSKLAAKCRAKGLKLGVYDNPLWIKGERHLKVPGTDYTIGSLLRNEKDEVLYPDVTDSTDFTWLVTDHPGAREYIDGWFKHYHDLGVEFVRMDFMCWYEDSDPGRDYLVTCGYGRERYERGLAYICEAAAKYGIFTSIVMPELYNDAELEKKYCNMTRIVQDTNIGGWHHFSSFNRGTIYNRWPYADNQMDGFIHWSHIGGRGKIILDGDFLRLNKCSNDDERRSQVSLQIIAGGPVAIADTPETIGDLASFYTNEELLALHEDEFVGKPLTQNHLSSRSCYWWGTTSRGEVVLAMFNREDNNQTMSVNLSELNMEGNWRVRDLWTHAYAATGVTNDNGALVSGTFSADVPPHGCKVVKFLPEKAPKPDRLYMVGVATPGYWDISNASEMTLENGEFVYRGPLFKGEVRFVSERNWDSINYIPEGDNGTWLTIPGNVYAFNGDPHEFARHWWVNDVGTYEVRMKVDESGNNASLSAVRIGDLPSMMTVLGASSGTWDNQTAHTVYASADQPDILEWKGVIRPDDRRCHIKFAAFPAPWWESTFYIPETVDYNGNVKMVKPGETYNYREEYGGVSDHFWGVEPQDCGFFRVTVNKAAKTVTFSNNNVSGNEQVVSVPSGRLDSRFVGNTLYVDSEGKTVAVYNIYGQRLGFSNDGRLIVEGLPNGTYIIKSDNAVCKIAR